jgi:hypothetical protein
MDRSSRHPSYSQTGATDISPKTPDERQRLLHFQRYSYSVYNNTHENTSTLPLPNVTSRMQNVKAYLSADISTGWADLVLLACFFISGMVDAGAYNAYECFVSMQVCLSVLSRPIFNSHADSAHRQATQFSPL